MNNESRELPTMSSRSEVTTAPILIVRVRVLLLQPRRDHLQVRPRRLIGHPGFHPPDGVVRVISALPQGLAVHILRNPGLRLPRKAEALGHHPHDGVLLRIQLHRPAHRLPIARKAAVPQCVAENHDLVFAGLVLALGPGSAQHRPHAQQRKEIGFRRQHEDVLRLPTGVQVHIARPEKQRHVLKCAVLGSPIDEIRPREGISSRSRLRLVQAHQPVGIGIRQRAQQNRVDNAENSGIRADSDGQRSGRHQGEPARVAQVPEGITQVEQQVSHLSFRRTITPSVLQKHYQPQMNADEHP
jgi:hypothetical protein